MKKPQTILLILFCLLWRVDTASSEVACHPESRLHGASAPATAFPGFSGEGAAVVQGRISSHQIIHELKLRFAYEESLANGATEVLLPARSLRPEEGMGPYDYEFSHTISDVGRKVYVMLALNDPLRVLDRFIAEPGDTVRLEIHSVSTLASDTWVDCPDAPGGTVGIGT